MKYFNSREAEGKWSKYWLDNNIYSFDENSSKEVFSVDTPPPTVSGSLHIGHVFSYTHTDIISRFQRMAGKNVFYPIGWDDNGLPTERRVQNYYHIQCDPEVGYQKGLQFEEADRKTKKGRVRKISRKNFIEHCLKLTKKDEQVFMNLWKRNGLSVEWDREYSTIGKKSIKTAQMSFIDLYKKGELYNQAAPVMWDIDFETAVAQAEIEDRDEESLFHFINLTVENEKDITIATTRPELLPACIGITAHPDDNRYKHLFGMKATTPLFHSPVPIFPSKDADPEKGTGILMVCTFGDAMDVEWWKKEKLPLKQIIGKNGRILPVEFGEGIWESDKPKTARANMERLEGKTIKSARIEIIEMLEEGYNGNSYIHKPSESITHSVRFYEKGKRPLEILSSRQWFMSIVDKKETLLKAGDKINWNPAHMQKRYADWTENLKFDWCISRQRFFGVPIPVWYPLNEHGIPDMMNPILPKISSLPIDPASDTPENYTEDERDKPCGFTSERDIFDTWFTSSLTPQISSGWTGDKELFKKIFPMSIRPQSHEIIRTWTLYTIIKSILHDKSIPWENVLISGWILDNERKKMSKSKGNVLTPEAWFDKYGADSVRYWSAGAKLGSDTAFDEKTLKTGQKLVTKIFNASKFVLSFPPEGKEELLNLDKSFLAKLQNKCGEATELFNQFNFSGALSAIEGFFWHSFTDSYLELVKSRAKMEDGWRKMERDSAIYTLRKTLNILLRMFAPFLPFITEEIWSRDFLNDSKEISIHRCAWPTENDFGSKGDPEIFSLAAKCLKSIHSRKSEAGVSLKAEIREAEIALSEEELDYFTYIERDLLKAGRINRITTKKGSKSGGFYLRADIVK